MFGFCPRTYNYRSKSGKLRRRNAEVSMGDHKKAGARTSTWDWRQTRASGQESDSECLDQGSSGTGLSVDPRFARRTPAKTVRRSSSRPSSILQIKRVSGRAHQRSQLPKAAADRPAAKGSVESIQKSKEAGPGSLQRWYWSYRSGSAVYQTKGSRLEFFDQISYAEIEGISDAAKSEN